VFFWIKPYIHIHLILFITLLFRKKTTDKSRYSTVHLCMLSSKKTYKKSINGNRCSFGKRFYNFVLFIQFSFVILRTRLSNISKMQKYCALMMLILVISIVTVSIVMNNEASEKVNELSNKRIGKLLL
jgi:hypothetical protein